MMNGKAWFWYFVIGLIYIAILVVLVRPGSGAANAVTTLGDGLASLVAVASGYGNLPAHGTQLT